MLQTCLFILFSLSFLAKASLFENEQGLGDFASVFGELFNDMSDCHYECQNGLVPTSNPNHIPTSNGCGSYGVKIESDNVPGMTKCCDKHDLCYDKCGSGKKQCDDKFKECLETICEKNKKKMSKKEYSGCKSTAKLLYGGTSVLGCEAYLESQRNACVCSRKRGPTDNIKRIKRSEL